MERGKIMTRWVIIFVILAAIIIAFCFETASMLASNTAIANIVTTSVTFVATLALILQWQFPQTQSPQPLSRKELTIASASLALVMVVGTIGGVFAYNQLLPNNSFAHIVEGKSTVNTDFLFTQWDHGDIGQGSCTPHPQIDPQTSSFDVVAWSQAKDSTKPQPGGTFSCALAPNVTIAGNMALQVTMSMNDGAVAGVTFKDTNTYNTHDHPHNFYLYSINVITGHYQFSKAESNQSTNMDDAENPAIHKGLNSPNTLALTMIDQRICLYANQSLLHCIPDQQPYETGTIGLFVGAYPGNATFSALKVWEL